MYLYYHKIYILSIFDKRKNGESCRNVFAEVELWRKLCYNTNKTDNADRKFGGRGEKRKI